MITPRIARAGTSLEYCHAIGVPRSARFRAAVGWKAPARIPMHAITQPRTVVFNTIVFPGQLVERDKVGTRRAAMLSVLLSTL